jgi:hypothetical protein
MEAICSFETSPTSTRQHNVTLQRTENLKRYRRWNLKFHKSVVCVGGGGRDRLGGLVVRVLNYRSRGPGFDSRALQKKKVVGLKRGPLSLVSTTEELLDRKVAAPV